MRITLQYTTTAGESRLCTTSIATIVKWERLYRRKISSMAEGIGAEDLCFFAYESTRAAGTVVPATLDLFIEQLETMPQIVEDDTANPTQPAAPAGS
jgi:hypothetical protein